MARFLSVIFITLTLFLGMFFFFIGLLKITPELNRDIHREIRRNFVRYAKVVPVFSQLGIPISPHSFRLFVGYNEVLCGIIMTVLPESGSIKQYCNVYLILLMFGAIFTHFMVGDQFSKMLPAICFLAFLILRLILYYILRRDQENKPPTEQKLNKDTDESIDLSKKKTVGLNDDAKQTNRTKRRKVD